MGFNPADYEDVDSRLHRFYDKHSEGRVETEIVQTPGQSWTRDDGATLTAGSWVVKAYVFREAESLLPAGTGFAEEVPGSSNVNRTSALENCETSAVGRALANAGYSPKGQRASRQEMEKVQRSSAEATPAQPTSKTRREVSAETVGESSGNASAKAAASTEEPQPVLPSAGSPRDTGEEGSDSPPRQDSTPASPGSSSPAKSGGGVVGGEVGGIPPATDLVEAYGKSKVLVTARNIAKVNGVTVPTSTDEIDEDLAKLVGKHFDRADA